MVPGANRARSHMASFSFGTRVAAALLRRFDPRTKLFSNAIVGLNATQASTSAFHRTSMSNGHGQHNHPTMSDVTINGPSEKVIYQAPSRADLRARSPNGVPALPVIQDRRADSRQNPGRGTLPRRASQPGFRTRSTRIWARGFQSGQTRVPTTRSSGKPIPANTAIAVGLQPDSYFAAASLRYSPYADLPKHRGCMNEATGSAGSRRRARTGVADWSGIRQPSSGSTTFLMAPIISDDRFERQRPSPLWQYNRRLSR